ncbi:hypothetical protein [Caulobacter sp. B11]|uniref:hypothetical protein n=1 Tax=Caulobacter sp. B11 TaxID=2048899 RepID=UPI0013747E8F|nr:hypothetical protein [Caulobacter sp. B11]
MLLRVYSGIKDVLIASQIEFGIKILNDIAIVCQDRAALDRIFYGVERVVERISHGFSFEALRPMAMIRTG